jgi:hypothetical protein
MAHQLTIIRRAHGQRVSVGAIPKNTVGAAEVNSAFTRTIDTVTIEIDGATEAQIRGILQYAKCVDLALDTSSIETAITAVIPA